jgi:hypothetical protein
MLHTGDMACDRTLTTAVREGLSNREMVVYLHTGSCRRPRTKGKALLVRVLLLSGRRSSRG